MPRDYKKEYREYQSRPEQIRNRSSRNKARRKMAKRGLKMAGKDIDHKDGNPLNNSLGNLRAISKKANRSRK
jgi:hypothetical protein